MNFLQQSEKYPGQEWNLGAWNRVTGLYILGEILLVAGWLLF